MSSIISGIAGAIGGILSKKEPNNIMVRTPSIATSYQEDYERIKKESDERRKRQEERAKILIIARNKIIKNYLKPCSGDMYIKWLKGALAKGKEPTHFYDYSVDQWEWFVALKDFEIEPLYGSTSLNIIVPEHVEFLGGELAHSSLYFLKDFTTISTFGSIYMFKDC